MFCEYVSLINDEPDSTVCRVSTVLQFAMRWRAVGLHYDFRVVRSTAIAKILRLYNDYS
jgi:hypothetical protein